MELKVLSSNGTETGKTVNLPSEIFGVTPNDHAIYLDVKQYLANQRQGTHKTKDKSEVHYSTKKIKRRRKSPYLFPDGVKLETLEEPSAINCFKPQRAPCHQQPQWQLLHQHLQSTPSR